VRDTGGYDDGVARSGEVFLTIECEARFSRRDGEALLLMRMDVLRDDATRHAAPLETHESSVAVLRDGRVLDPLTGRGVEERSEADVVLQRDS